MQILLPASRYRHTALAQTPCEQLKSLKLTNTAITLAESSPPDRYRFRHPARSRRADFASVLPRGRNAEAFSGFRYQDGDLAPAGAVWNGKFEAVGGGGWVGAISYRGMATALQEGYATASTDTGHEGRSASFAVGHPEKVVDFSHRAVHEMTVKAKAIITAYYGRGPRLSYWNGCSTGGRQGLIAAQKYPEDFDGIIAGAPANNFTRLCAWRLALEAAVLKDPSEGCAAGQNRDC